MREGERNRLWRMKEEKRRVEERDIGTEFDRVGEEDKGFIHAIENEETCEI